jgi:hypothetical protein
VGVVGAVGICVAIIIRFVSGGESTLVVTHAAFFGDVVMIVRHVGIGNGEVTIERRDIREWFRSSPGRSDCLAGAVRR